MKGLDTLDTQDVFNFFKRVEQEILGNEPEDYFIAAVVLALGLLLMLGLRALFHSRLVGLISKRLGTHSDNPLVKKTLHALFSILLILPFYAAFGMLNFSPEARKAVHLVFLFVLTWRAMLFFSSFFIALLDAVLRRTESYMGIRAISPIINFVVWAIGLSFMMDNVGLKVSSIMAGLGIMGIAVGLASQAALGDFFGYLSILLDRPFKIGDAVTAGGRSGVIERVGFKTTKMRAATGELIAVPNGDISKQAVVNNAMTTERGRIFQFGITYETPLEKVKAVPGIVSEIVNSMPKTRLERVNFISFADSSLLFEAFFMVQTHSGMEVLNIQHRINMEIMERFAKEGIEFAYPTNTYVANTADVVKAAPPPQGEDKE